MTNVVTKSLGDWGGEKELKLAFGNKERVLSKKMKIMCLRHDYSSQSAIHNQGYRFIKNSIEAWIFKRHKLPFLPIQSIERECSCVWVLQKLSPFFPKKKKIIK